MKKLIHIDNMTKEELKRELSFYMKERKSAPDLLEACKAVNHDNETSMNPEISIMLERAIWKAGAE